MASFDRAETLNKVVEVVAKILKVEKNTVVPTATLQDLGADSLDMAEIIIKLEEVFGIEINDDDAEKLHNVNEVVEYVHNLRTK
ncbi:MAG: acyl carrier protein [Candidatus Dependentiae bacterium]|nr:acyl carrier protein [Candidatus Dependentiae bacterium]